MTAHASANGWLDSLGYFRYSKYWERPDEHEAFDFDLQGDEEKHWREATLRRVLIMLLAHARRCGIGQGQFFLDAHVTLDKLESFLSGLGDEEIELRARRFARSTTQDLLAGPEYPATSIAD